MSRVENPDLPGSVVADLLGISAKKLHDMIAAGQIPGGYMLPLSNRRRVPVAALRAFMTAHDIPHIHLDRYLEKQRHEREEAIHAND